MSDGKNAIYAGPKGSFHHYNATYTCLIFESGTDGYIHMNNTDLSSHNNTKKPVAPDEVNFGVSIDVEGGVSIR